MGLFLLSPTGVERAKLFQFLPESFGGRGFDNRRFLVFADVVVDQCQLDVRALLLSAQQGAVYPQLSTVKVALGLANP